MGEREDDLEGFMEQWRKEQRSLERRLYGKRGANLMQTTEDQAAEEEDSQDITDEM